MSKNPTCKQVKLKRRTANGYAFLTAWLDRWEEFKVGSKVKLEGEDEWWLVEAIYNNERNRANLEHQEHYLRSTFPSLEPSKRKRK